MGNETKTVQNLQVFRILEDENCILVRGAVPGAANEYVTVTEAATRAAYKGRARARPRSGRRTRSRRPRRPPPVAASRGRSRRGPGPRRRTQFEGGPDPPSGPFGHAQDG